MQNVKTLQFCRNADNEFTQPFCKQILSNMHGGKPEIEILIEVELFNTSSDCRGQAKEVEKSR